MIRALRIFECYLCFFYQHFIIFSTLFCAFFTISDNADEVMTFLNIADVNRYCTRLSLTKAVFNCRECHGFESFKLSMMPVNLDILWSKVCSGWMANLNTPKQRCFNIPFTNRLPCVIQSVAAVEKGFSTKITIIFS